MKKLSLDLDALRVDSFDATPHAWAARGTVRGNDSGFTTQTTFTVGETCGESISGQPCVELPATPATLCSVDCV